MRLPKLFSLLSLTLLATLPFTTPTPAHADTYQIIPLGTDGGVFFYGMDDSGDVTFLNEISSACGPGVFGCYETTNTLPGGSQIDAGYTANPPGLSFAYASGMCVSPAPYSSPCLLTYDGRTAEIAANPPGEENLFAYSGSAPPQLLFTTGFGGIFAINGLGDIIFDNGLADDWEEAIDLTTLPDAVPPASLTTPEPSTLLLLATALLPLTLLTRRRTAS